MKAEAKPPIPEPRRGSCLPKALLGCGCAVVVGGVLLLVAGGGAIFYGLSMVGDFSEPFVAEGYTQRMGQVFEERDALSEKTVFTAQVVTLKGGAEDDVAMACQVANVHGTVDGDIDFFGQTLNVQKDAIVSGNVHAKGVQILTVHGTIEGDLDMMGQILVVEDGGAIHGNVHLDAAQSVVVKGQVLGEITGNYQSIKRTDLKPKRIDVSGDEA